MVDGKGEISPQLTERLLHARKVLVLTGAGVSAESGVPTFRGGGLTAAWKGMPFDEISSARMAREDLPEVWAWFAYRRQIIAHCRPNPAHFTLAEWAGIFPEFTLVTQNIDGLQQRAGSKRVLELHGNIHRARCEQCSESITLKELNGAAEGQEKAEFCAFCSGRLRPDGVLFGETLPVGVFEKAAIAAQNCDLCFVIGTSALVYPAASLPEIAAQAGAYLIEINPETTHLTPFCDEVIRGAAGEILPKILSSPSPYL